MNYDDSFGFGYNNQPTTAPYRQGNPKRINLDTVRDYTLADMGITVEKLKDSLIGMDLVDPVTGRPLPDRFYKNAIQSAVGLVEKELDIKILPRLVTENHDYYVSDYNSYNFVQLRQRPVLQVEEFVLQMPMQAELPYPAGWWKVNPLQGSVNVMPTAGLMTGMQNPQNGVGLLLFDQYTRGNTFGNNQSSYLPSVFKVNYVAGMLPQAREGVEEEWEIGTDLSYIIDKIAQRDLFLVYSRLGGLGAGIQGQTLSIDGISESRNTTASAMYGLMSSDIETLNDQIEEGLAKLRGKYAPSMTVI